MIAAANRTVEVDLQEKTVYTSINYMLNEEEINAIKEMGVKAAVVQAFNPRNPRPEGMISTLKGDAKKEGLLERTYRDGIEKPLIFMPSWTFQA